MNLKAIIVDDEKHSRETLKNLVEEFCDGIEVLATASSIVEALEVIPKMKPDLLFLDIELQTGTGFDILNLLPEINFEIIFTTAFDQYAIKAVKFSSLDYLLKPIDLDELQIAIEKARKLKDKQLYNLQLQSLIHNLKQPKISKICLATTDGFEFVNIEEICYCEAQGSYTSFIFKSGKKILVSKHLKGFENLLSDHTFMRVHNSYLINLKEVNKFIKSDGGYIVMNNGDSVSISRSKKDEFLEAMQKGD
jgi:two-component system, LytTR family, response regulator